MTEEQVACLFALAMTRKTPQLFTGVDSRLRPRKPDPFWFECALLLLASRAK